MTLEQLFQLQKTWPQFVFPISRGLGLYFAHAHEVKPVAGPTGFRWFVQALAWDEWKTGGHGEPITLIGKPARTNISGPHASRADALAAVPVPR